MGRTRFAQGFDRVMRTVNTVTCADSDARKAFGCGTWWVEYDGHAREFCPKRGKRAQSGEVIVNDDDAPKVNKLHDKNVLVVGDEKHVG